MLSFLSLISNRVWGYIAAAGAAIALIAYIYGKGYSAAQIKARDVELDTMRESKKIDDEVNRQTDYQNRKELEKWARHQ